MFAVVLPLFEMKGNADDDWVNWANQGESTMGRAA